MRDKWLIVCCQNVYRTATKVHIGVDSDSLVRIIADDVTQQVVRRGLKEGPDGAELAR